MFCIQNGSMGRFFRNFFFFSKHKELFLMKIVCKFPNQYFLEHFWNIFRNIDSMLLQNFFFIQTHTYTLFKDTKNTLSIKCTHLHTYKKTKMTSYIFLLKILTKCCWVENQGKMRKKFYFCCFQRSRV